MAKRLDFRRIVLGMGPGSIDRRMLRVTANLARLLELEMLGVFVEDQTVFAHAELPFARELRLPGYAWQSIDAQRVTEDLHTAAELARRVLDEEGTACGAICRFEVRRGNPAALFSSLGELTDILVASEPADAVDWLTPSILRAQRSALASFGAVLFLPPSSGPETGPIAVLASDPAEGAVSLAARIAKAAGEELVVVVPSDLSSAGIAAALARALGHRHERLMIMARGVADGTADSPAVLASRRRAPVLIVDGNGPEAETRRHRR